MIWYGIPGNEKFLVNEAGDIKSYLGTPIKTYISTNGYRAFSYYAGGGRKNHKMTTMGVHRAVAKALIPNPRNLPEVNHKDGNKLNNHYENLEWVTSKENKAHAVKLGLGYIGERNSHARLTPVQVLEIRKRHSDGAYGTLELMGAEYGVGSSAIWSVVNKRTWRHI